MRKMDDQPAEAYTLTVRGRPGYLQDSRGAWKRVLSPNARPHWGSRAEAMRKDSEAIWAAARTRGAPPRPPCPFQHASVSVELVVPVNRRRDAENTLSTLKGVMDSLVRLGIIVDDDLATIGMPTVTIVVDKARAYEYTVTVEEA
jgi:hypothetical protein